MINCTLDLERDNEWSGKSVKISRKDLKLSIKCVMI